MSLTKVTYSMINKAPVSVLDYGADPTGVTSSQSAIVAASTFVSADPGQYCLVFPSGTYTYDTAPNWGVSNMLIKAEGFVKLNYTGTGNCVIFDGGAASTQSFNVQFLGNFHVNGTAASKNGIYLRACHHSKIEGRVTGCTLAGLKTEFTVASEFNVVVSSNEGAFTSVPTYGYNLASRASNEATSGCTFYNPILEGINNHGILLTNSDSNTFIGGTSEGNGGYGIYVLAGSTRNTFIGIDLETNAGAIYDAGNYNTYLNIIASDTSSNDGTNNSFTGGQYGGIVNSATAFLTNIAYTGLTNTGSVSKSNVYNITSGKFEANLNIDSLETLVSVDTATATTAITLPSTGSHFYQVCAYYLNGTNTSYSAYALIAQAATTATVLSHVDGASLAITLVGSVIKVTQTSGGTILVNVVAQAIF